MTDTISSTNKTSLKEIFRNWNLKAVASSVLPPSEAGIEKLKEYLISGREVRSFTITVLADGFYVLPNDTSRVKKFIDTYWVFADWRKLIPGATYNLLAIDANDGKSNARFPICVVDVLESDDDEECRRFSSKWFKAERDGTYFGKACENIRKIAGTQEAPPNASEDAEFVKYAEKHEAKCLETMHEQPLLNTKDGLVDIGRMVGGELCSYWVPIPEFVRLAPNVQVSKALLEKGMR